MRDPWCHACGAYRTDHIPAALAAATALQPVPAAQTMGPLAQQMGAPPACCLEVSMAPQPQGVPVPRVQLFLGQQTPNALGWGGGCFQFPSATVPPPAPRGLQDIQVVTPMFHGLGSPEGRAYLAEDTGSRTGRRTPGPARSRQEAVSVHSDGSGANSDTPCTLR